MSRCAPCWQISREVPAGVNILVALGHTLHGHHERVRRWQKSLSPPSDVLGTCAISELGFVRISVQAGLQTDIAIARAALARLKASGPVRYELWGDSIGVDLLPA